MSKNTKEDIEQAIRDAVGRVTGITELDSDLNLVSKELGIAPANFLYIFDIFEKALGLPIHDILKSNNYQVMTVANLTEALYALDKGA